MTVFKLEQSLKAHSLILTTLLGILSVMSLSQLMNILEVISCKPSGRDKEAQLLKADCEYDVTLEGIEDELQATINLFDSVSIIALQSSRESYLGFFTSTVIEDKPVHSSKELSLMLVTLSGI